MKNLLAVTIITLTFFSCQKDDLTEAIEPTSCDCYSPLGVFAQWDYETIRNFYDVDGRMESKTKEWTNIVQNVTGHTSGVFEDGQVYHMRKQGSDVNNLYSVRYIRQSSQKYLSPSKLFLQDAPVGTQWTIDNNKERIIVDRPSYYTIGNKVFKDVIVVEEIKTYSNGDSFILAKEYYAKNIGLIQSTVYTYDNQLVSTDTKKLVNYLSELDI